METNFIANIQDQKHKQRTVFNWSQLNAINFGFDQPFDLQLLDEQIFEGQAVLRLVPKRRIVMRGMWLNKPVVAKLFFHPQHAKKHFEKELAGYEILRTNKIPTPPLYYQGMSEDRRIYILLFEYIPEADNLEALWLQQPNFDAALPLLRAVILELATQHVLGVLQQDLHLKNFLVTKKTLYTLDAAQLIHFPPILARKLSLKNIALFTCQLGALTNQQQEKLFLYYGKCRGWVIKQEDIFEFFAAIKKYNLHRWQQYEKKIFRTSTQFVALHEWARLTVADRAYQGPAFNEFLKNPEQIFADENTHYLKKGRSTTVIKANFDGHDLVIKRYNLKNFMHRLRRCLRRTRAYTCWRYAQKFQLFRVQTAKPVAFIEKRILGFRGISYFVTEYVPGVNAQHFLTKSDDKEVRAAVIKSIAALLKQVAKLELTHGDLKVTNILINELQIPTLIDLDGAAEHLSLSGLRAMWRKEIKRFLENFKNEPELLTQFEMELL